MRRLRRVIPMTCGMLFMLLFTAAAFLFLRGDQAPSGKTAAVMLSAAGLAEFVTGWLCGILLEHHIFRKMKPESYRRLVYIITAVSLLLMVLCAIAGLYQLGIL